MLKDLDKCIECLVKSDRIPEAAFFARTYCPSRISGVVKLWKEDLAKISKVASQSLTDPTDYPQKFPELALGMKAEKLLEDFYKTEVSSEEYQGVMGLFNFEILDKLKEDENLDLAELLSQPPECPDDPFQDEES